MFTKVQSKQSVEILKQLGWILPYVFVIGLWAHFCILNSVPFWQIEDDYPWHSISHALSIESGFLGYPAINHGVFNHPGIPFGYASWIAYKLALLSFPPFNNEFELFTKEAESFWLYAKSLALLLTLVGMFLLNYIFRKSMIRFFIGVGILFAASSAYLHSALTSLKIESFALIYITTFYFLIYKWFHYSEQQQLYLFRFKILRRDILAVIFGVLTIFGATLKIYYLAPAVGLVVALTISVWLGYIKNKIYLKTISIFIISVFASSLFVIFIVIDWYTFSILIKWNFNMLTHSGYYGSGEAGFLDAASVVTNFKTLSIQPVNIGFWLITVTMITAYISLFLINRNIEVWKKNNLPFFCALMVGVTIGTIGLLKHYSPHYAIPIIATLTCFPLIEDRGLLNRVIILISFACLLISLSVLNISLEEKKNSKNIDFAYSVIDDLKTINQLPLQPHEKRVWGYRCLNSAGTVSMIKQYARSTYFTPMINDLFENDISPLDSRFRDTLTWKYVIFPKTYYPTEESIGLKIESMFDFKVTQFELEKKDKVVELENFFVVVKNPSPLTKGK